MTPNQPHLEKLCHNVRDELAAMQTFVTTLQNEQQALIESNAEALIAITPQKNEILNGLLGFETQRNNLLAQFGSASSNEGIQALLAQTGDATWGNQWQQLLELSAQAQELNRTNGLLINRQMSRNQSALNILKNDQSGSLYGADGQTKIANQTSRGIVAG